ncbi:penicillin-binding transpeptidase domain-containing protein [Fodinicola acaciae]|uniref:penicillin-binding transpeptidase domain-containing protein n=1 Tax=Fodinicola acaciae TaxID=2681555 RepID=UPI0013D65742|nr:penicillin-binding transpeptidase domain-containing protein [Fodinicola acaciae]
MYAYRRNVAAALAIVLVAGVAGCGLFGDSPPVAAAKAFLTAWNDGRYDDAAAQTDAGSAAKDLLTATASQTGAKASVKAGSVTEKDGVATASYTVTWPLDGGTHPWSYAGTLKTAKSGDNDRVHWTPAVVQPTLTAGQRLQVSRTLPLRAPLTDRTGRELYAKLPVVTIGLEPQKVTDLAGEANTLASVLKPEGVVAADIVRDVRKAKPSDFVPVITLRQDRYNEVKPQIYDLPGASFQTGQRTLAVDKDFAPALLGRVGAPTAEVLKESGLGKVTGDIGISGLQRALNDKLTGTPSTVVSRVDAAGNATKLATFNGKSGTPVKLTLDPKVQQAAQSALSSVSLPATIVAVRPSTGEILAVAQTSALAYDIGVNGSYPAGSTFKMITAAALLETGKFTEDTVVPCPGSTVIGGKKFINENSFDLGNVPLRTAFAQSCNTTFGGQAAKLPAADFMKAVSQFGVGAGWTLPGPAFSGSLPAPASQTEQAADAIGQGKVEVSPLTMALVAGAIQRGSLPTPSLVAGQPATAKKPPPPIPSAVIGPLRDLTRAVVTSGTGKADLSGFAGVGGKTGTAEYGTDTPPRTHSWFAGYSGDLSFAVFAYDGATDAQAKGTTIAARFLSGLR